MQNIETVINQTGYEIIRLLDDSAFCNSYLVKDKKFGRFWVYKTVPKDGGFKEDCLRKEAMILGKLDYIGVPVVIDLIETEDFICLVREYVSGKTLEEYIKENRVMSESEVVDIGIKIAKTLLYLHEQSTPILFLDLKPSNIVIKYDGSIKLIDFGAAIIEGTEKISAAKTFGTMGYCAPEQLGTHKQSGEGDLVYINPTNTADIYALGASLRHMATGISPAKKPEPIREINPALSEGLEKIIMVCCETSPQNRYKSCAELINALENYKSLGGAKNALILLREIIYHMLIITAAAFLGIGASGFYSGGENMINIVIAIMITALAHTWGKRVIMGGHKNTFIKEEIKHIVRP